MLVGGGMSRAKRRLVGTETATRRWFPWISGIAFDILEVLCLEVVLTHVLYREGERSKRLPPFPGIGPVPVLERGGVGDKFPPPA